MLIVILSLCLSGLGLLAFAQNLAWAYVGAYLVVGSCLLGLLYQIFHQEDWE